MHECSTVEEVISWINIHQWHSYMHDQMQFADATGDAVIISAGKDGEVVFTRKPSGDGFIVSTNFNVANTANGYGYPDWRYDKAQELSDPREAGPLSRLFPDDVQKEAGRRYHQAQARARSCKVIGMSWTGIILVS